MPMLAFHCDNCSNEFEKIMPAHKKLYKWCTHCNQLTSWEIINGEKVCNTCLGSKYIPPVSPSTDIKVEESIQETCPKCKQLANHVLRIEARGKHKGQGTTVADSSVRFHFNYISNTNE